MDISLNNSLYFNSQNSGFFLDTTVRDRKSQKQGESVSLPTLPKKSTEEKIRAGPLKRVAAEDPEGKQMKLRNIVTDSNHTSEKDARNN